MGITRSASPSPSPYTAAGGRRTRRARIRKHALPKNIEFVGFVSAAQAKKLLKA